MQIVLFQTIQFSMSIKFVKKISISNYSVLSILFQTIQFSISLDFVYTQFYFQKICLT